MADGHIPVWAATAMALATGLVPSAVWAFIQLARNRTDTLRQQRKDSIDEWQAIAARYEKQNERANDVILQHQGVIQALSDEHSDCRMENADLRDGIRRLYEAFKSLHGAAVRAGGFDPGPLPEMPELQERPRTARTAYLLRQAAQSAELLKESSQVIKPAPND